MLQNLAVRRTELDRRENALRLQIAALAAVEMRIAAKLADMSKIKAEIEALLKRPDDDEEAKLRSLVKIYENMKPKSAARIFQKLDMKVLLEKLMPLSQVIRFRPPRWVCRRPDACRWRSCFGPFPPFFRALPPDYVATTSLMPEEPGTTG